MTQPFPEPTTDRSGRAEVLVEYLDFFRSRVVDAVRALPEEDRRTSRLPSGWTPLQLANHLAHVERRWLEWGFEGHDVADPWGDSRDGRWSVADDARVDDVLGSLVEQGERTRAVVAAHDLDERGQPGPRWEGREPATLERVLLHLVQEHARHLGHLDVVFELPRAGPGSDRRRRPD